MCEWAFNVKEEFPSIVQHNRVCLAGYYTVFRIFSIFLCFSVTAITDDGHLEGVLRGQTGVFPSKCVQEVRLRNPDKQQQQSALCQTKNATLDSPQQRVQGRRDKRQKENLEQFMQSQEYMEAMKSKAHM